MIPQVSRDVLEVVIEQEFRSSTLDYSRQIVTELEKTQPELVQYAREMSSKLPGPVADCEQEYLPQLKYAIFLSILIPLKAVYNQLEVNQLKQ